ncbi:MAG: hypothetical protein KKB91_13105 [Proteobacteria bacterium]|jgi:hypothetical protein|nr:hypothetical protein [Pseudomonadota bacterium]MCG2742900.1 hypothetical protein [Desulfobacteraceae bacterium]MBU3983767.1 hypothetical protein [Pseudomonadota bacterium]MBU4027949.1 hypothetical protein [Pseudomonadota bacterium]MBU4042435.1 hypothetical protein [Pseudomonadota bacterium]
MAGAIAHRFSNTMMVVLGRMERLELILPAKTKERDMTTLEMVDGQ